MVESVLASLFKRLVLRPWWRLSRGLTLGAFGLVRDGDGRVFLIRQSYAPGWSFPGGGVERNESVATALRRELSEEGNIKLGSVPPPFGIYRHPSFTGDHIVFFVLDDWMQDSQPQPNREIIDHGFFAIDDLPPDTTAATRRRIAEVCRGQSVSECW